MGSHEQAIVTDNDALEFARSIIAFDSAELVSSRAWARTYRLSRGKLANYLKIVPQHKAGILAPVSALARHFNKQIPKAIAFDAQRGWLLSAEHGGCGMKYDSPDQDLLELVRTYARLQADAAKTPALFNGLPQPDIAALPRLLLEFLRPSEPAPGASPEVVGADYFIGKDDAVDFHRSLERRVALLEQHMALASELPLTVNHGDLRPPNAAVMSDHSCVILDWDDAMVGPAGMSLHGLFGGCTVPTILLSGSAAAEAAADTPNGVLIATYVEALASGGYCDRGTLKRALPASMCAGMIQFMLNFASFPGEEGRSPVGETLGDRLSNLLDLCDLLTARSPENVLEYVQDYEDHQQYRRAEQLLTDHSLRHPNDVDIMARLAAVQRKRENLDEAAQTYRNAIELAPRAAALHASLGGVLMEQLEVDDAQQELRRALELDPGVAGAREDLDRVVAIEAMQQQALQPDRMPILRFEPSDTAAGVIRPEMVALGTSLFETYGTLQIDNAFPVETITRLHDAFTTRYAPYFREADHPDALYLGDKRYMLTVDLEDPFSDPGVLGAPMVLPIIRELLGEDCVLGAYTAVISLPGSKDQRLHKDHPALFPDTQWHHTLPSFAVQIIIPLVPLDELTGTTRFYKGSHRVPTDAAEESGAQDPLVPLGSCLLNDYRCAHRGLANQSQVVRPIVTLIFNRRWFRDFKNYSQQPPLRLTDAAYEQLPEDLRPLFSWWKEERKHDLLARAQLRQRPAVVASET
jgi:tetratricopeptide (TPR) repeat protein